MARVLSVYGTEIRLSNEEGDITVWLEKKLTEEEIAKIKIGDNWSVRLVHSPYCQGTIKTQKVSKTKNVIFCTKCYMRILIPIDVSTLGDLVNY